MQNKTYLIVGASSGIGKGIAEYLTTEIGANVVLVARRYEIIKELADTLPGNNHAIECDISVLENVANIFAECEEKNIGIDGVVYAAGIAPLFSLKENNRTEMLQTMNVNALAFAEVASCMLNAKCIKENCSVVAISSIVSQAVTNRQSAYAGSKSMLNTYVKFFAKEALGKFRINAILPGVVETEMYQNLRKQSADLDEKTKRNQPLGIIPVDRVAKLTRYLLSDESDFMTGSLLVLDGGYLLK